MRIISFAAAILLAAQGTALATPFDGDWYYVCPDKAVDAEPMVVIEGNTMRRYESECEVKTIEPIGTRGQAWRATSACGGEGERWTEESVYGLEHDSNNRVARLMEIDMTEGWVQSYLPCK